MTKAAVLALENGTTFFGTSIGAEGTVVGEAVFNTAMTGYQEILTDPSYARQLVALTFPHIGNVGVTAEDDESGAVRAEGLIIRDVPDLASNWRLEESLPAYLQRHHTVAIAGIDTRKLTRILRTEGALNACLMAGAHLDPQQAIEQARQFSGLKGMDLAKEVSVKHPYSWNEGVWQLGESSHTSTARFKVVVYDYGVKRNILRMLAERDCDLTVVPAQTPVDEVLALKPDGVFLSNGPGDPEPCAYAIDAIQTLLAHDMPMFGICLGHQLLGLAAGAHSTKMKFGHHGANHPVQDLSTKAVLITSQNHGFAIDESSLPNTVRATHRSLFDGSLQGLELLDKPAFGFQGHPEASPGPHDADYLFDKFIALMR
jgi:carbamoyl-phosphate synthase small subunit